MYSPSAITVDQMIALYFAKISPHLVIGEKHNFPKNTYLIACRKCQAKHDFPAEAVISDVVEWAKNHAEECR